MNGTVVERLNRVGDVLGQHGATMIQALLILV